MNDHKIKNKFDRLIDQMDRYPSLEKLQLYRNLYLGAGAACLVLLSQLLSTGAQSIWLKISLASCAMAMPLWLGLAGVFEYYIVLGPKSYPHKRSGVAVAIIGLLILVAGLCMVSSIAASLYQLYPLASLLFLGSVGVAIVATCIFHWHLARWYFSRPSVQDDSAST